MEENNYQIEIEKKPLEVKIKDWAEQTSGSCLVRYGDTEILATAVMSKKDAEGFDFFPLTVDYEERYYAAGKIFGSRFIRRETRPADEAVLTARMIDRTIRPRFPEDFKKEIQVIITCLSWDSENDPDILGIIAASTALSISDIPWQGPAAAIRVGKINEQWIFNPTYEQREKSELDLTLTAVEKENQILINMIELGAKEIPESLVLEAIAVATPQLKKIIDFQKEIAKNVGKPKTPFVPFSDPKVEKEVKKFLAGKTEQSIYQKERQKTYGETAKLQEELVKFAKERYQEPEKIKYAISLLEKERERILQENVIKYDKRPDGRKSDELREISCEVGLLPRTHGSALFRRGETKVLSILTLGGPNDQQILEGMEFVGKKRFLHHYNFPPYSSGEVSPLRGPKRREIGHGCLAEKSLLPLIPNLEDFPYTIRTVSEVLSSNGSTSMASVCAASLALMDAGVPIKGPAAGIAIGIAKNESSYKILTDIQGPEDALGGMDFKVAGTQNGITAIQLDVKIDGLTPPMIKEALEQAKKARLEILQKTNQTLSQPRSALSQWAPRIYKIQINPEKIGEVVGPKGKVINKIIQECGVGIDIDDSGLIFVTAPSEESAQKALDWIKNITREVAVGETFQGKAVRMLEFGVFVEILPGQTGLVHTSNLAPYQIRDIRDVVQIGDIIPVKVISIDEQGRINLSAIEAGFRPPKTTNQNEARKSFSRPRPLRRRPLR